MQTLYIFRHGETDYNKQRIIQGILDIPLNETGLQQAYALAELLSNSGIQLIYSSKLQRAHRTAEIVAHPYRNHHPKHRAVCKGD